LLYCIHEIKKKSFTLIELLVVVSIIGTLSTIAVGGLGEGRDRARYIKAKAGIKQLQTQAELYLSQYGNYGTFTPVWNAPCPQSPATGTPTHVFENPDFHTAFSAIAAESGITVFDNDDFIRCYSNGNGFALYIGTPLGAEVEANNSPFALDPESFGLCIDSFFNFNRVPGVGGMQ